MKEIKTIAVVGLGYVGLPLAMLAEQKGFSVIGIEKSAKKLEALKQKKPVIDDEVANKQLVKTNAKFSSDFSNVKNADSVIICVPTPVDSNKNPDLSLVKNAVQSAVTHMKPGSLLVIESTINPGVCDEVLIPLIEKETSHIIGKTIYVAHCPERINPGDSKWNVGNINRVLGADSETGLEMAYGLYTKLIAADIKKMGSLMETEAVKVVENSFRDINIAFVNELAMSFSTLGINVNNVIDGAATKPFAFMAHYPGIGVGGHCIPVDPYYLIEYAKNKGFDHKFLSLARNINEAMPVYAVDKLEEALIQKTGKTLNGAKVAVLGLSYKPNVADDRESPAYKVIVELERRGAKVETYDPYMLEKSTAKTFGKALTGKEAVVLVTTHNQFKNTLSPKYLKKYGVRVFIDGRNMLHHLADEFYQENIFYSGIGT